jgi:NAD-dependent dihydropyrimidine dehydrogenase PreA subunit
VIGVAVLLKDAGYEVKIEADLCRKAMEVSPEMKEIVSGAIFACYSRAVRSLFDRIGMDADMVIDIRSQNDCCEILSPFGVDCSESEATNGKEAFRKIIENFPIEKGIDAWYPVIDKTRCTECGKCHDFCLFGVYSVENRKILVTQPQNCKNNCPACARMCPSKAIIFPKYEKSPINGGTAQEETFNPEEMNRMYHERLRMRLQQRRASVSLLK